MDGFGEVIESDNEQISLSDQDLEVAETSESTESADTAEATEQAGYENEVSAEDDIVEV
jgi:hypothetical protein